MTRRVRIPAMVLVLALAAPPVFAQPRTADEAVDVALGLFEEPLRPWRPGVATLVPGAPVWPPFNQEPPAAQGDFRISAPAAPPAPTVAVPPVSADAPEPSTTPPTAGPAPSGKPPAPPPPKPCPKPPKPCV